MIYEQGVFKADIKEIGEIKSCSSYAHTAKVKSLFSLVEFSYLTQLVHH